MVAKDIIINCYLNYNYIVDLCVYSGVTRVAYRAAVRVGLIDWDCQDCVAGQANPPDDPPVDQTDDPQEVSLYAADLGEFNAPNRHDESQMADPAPPPHPVPVDDGPVTYTLVEDSSSRGKVCTMT